jgi:anti-anti-sigma factor
MSDREFRHLATRTDRGVLVVRVTLPELHGDAVTEALAGELVRSVEGMEAPRVVLDCGAVTYLTSLGIAAFLRFWQLVRARGGKVCVCGVTPHVLEVLTATKLVQEDAASCQPFVHRPDVVSAVALLAASTA